MSLSVAWYFIIAGVLTVYLILDGGDLGIGILSLFTPNEKDNYRKQLLNLIGPHWNGNEVWLIVFGGLLFAVFPPVYAALLSAFYLQFIVLLAAFIFRGISIPMRDRYETNEWKKFWDLCFGLSSFAIIFLFGVLAANLIKGVPLDESGAMKADFLMTFSLFAILAGFFAAALFALYGAVYAGLHGSSEIGEFVFIMTCIAWVLVLVLIIPAEVLIFSYAPGSKFNEHPVLFIIFLQVSSIICILWSAVSGKCAGAFIASIVLIAGIVSMLCLCFFPDLLRCSSDPSKTLTVCNAAATEPAMIIVLILAAIAMPVVVSYSIYVHFKLRPSGTESGYY